MMISYWEILVRILGIGFDLISGLKSFFVWRKGLFFSFLFHRDMIQGKTIYGLDIIINYRSINGIDCRRFKTHTYTQRRARGRL